MVLMLTVHFNPPPGRKAWSEGVLRSEAGRDVVVWWQSGPQTNLNSLSAQGPCHYDACVGRFPVFAVTPGSADLHLQKLATAQRTSAVVVFRAVPVLKPFTDLMSIISLKQITMASGTAASLYGSLRNGK